MAEAITAEPMEWLDRVRLARSPEFFPTEL